MLELPATDVTPGALVLFRMRTGAPASRSRVADPRMQVPQAIEFRTIYEEKPQGILEVTFVSPPEQPV